MDSLSVLQDRLQGFVPRVALVLGSGFSAVAEQIDTLHIVSYRNIPDFPAPSVQGHAGQLRVGTWTGIGIACLQGRAHYYEGHAPAAIVTPIRTLAQLGCEIVILTNAAGSLQRDVGPGSLMMITDHINWAGVNPLIGPNDDTIGPRFFDMTQAYDPDLQSLLRDAAADAHIPLHEGVYLMYPGPNFETPAEIRAFARLGADAVGMSTVPECLAARHCGLRVAALSGITNLAAGMSAHSLSHEETLAEGPLLAMRLAELLDCFLRRLADA